MWLFGHLFEHTQWIGNSAIDVLINSSEINQIFISAREVNVTFIPKNTYINCFISKSLIWTRGRFLIWNLWCNGSDMNTRRSGVRSTRAKNRRSFFMWESLYTVCRLNIILNVLLFNISFLSLNNKNSIHISTFSWCKSENLFQLRIGDHCMLLPYQCNDLKSCAF